MSVRVGDCIAIKKQTEFYRSGTERVIGAKGIVRDIHPKSPILGLEFLIEWLDCPYVDPVAEGWEPDERTYVLASEVEFVPAPDLSTREGVEEWLASA